MNNTYNNNKFYFKYSEYNGCNNNSWNFVRKPFSLTFIKNDNTFLGQFLTSNWFQIPIKINKSYIFKIYSIGNNESFNSVSYNFILTADSINENINKMSNDKENVIKIIIYNQYGSFSIHLRSYFSDNKEIFLINLPEFNLNLN